MKLRSLLAALFIGALLAPMGCRHSEESAARDETLRDGVRRYRSATRAGGSAALDPATNETPAAPPVPEQPPLPPPPPRFLKVTVVSGEGIVENDPMGGDSDPFVRVDYAGESHTTAADEDAIDPVWGDSFVFEYVPGTPLTLALFDQDAASDDHLGTTTIFPEKPGPGPRDVSFKGGRNGVIHIELELVP